MLKQCRDYIRLLFQLCKQRELADNLQSHLFCIATKYKAEELVREHNMYMWMWQSVGRPGPLG